MPLGTFGGLAGCGSSVEGSPTETAAQLVGIPAMTFAKCSYVSLVLITIAFAVTPTAAFAYVDPATGGLIFQVIAPIVTIVMGGVIAFRNAVARQVSRMWKFLFH
jgi:hypothetical protein